MSRPVLRRSDLTLVHVHQARALNLAHSSPGDATAFADAYPVTLASAASLERLRGCDVRRRSNAVRSPASLSPSSGSAPTLSSTGTSSRSRRTGGRA